MSEKTKKQAKRLQGKYIFAIASILILIGLIISIHYSNQSKVKVGNLVAVDYIGTFGDGSVFDTSIQAVAAENEILDSRRNYEPIQFTVGNADMIKGFENAVVGMKVGETKKITIKPEDAYGNVRKDLMIIINASNIQLDEGKLEVGRPIISNTGASGVITDIRDGKVTIDFNHPLAGKVLNFEIKLVNVIK